MKNHFIQGDVLIKRIDSIPSTAKRIGRKELAFGEVTGHSHSIADLDAAYLLENAEDLFMAVTADGGVEIRHQEHAAQVIPPGNYEIVRQTEEMPWGEQRVAD